MISKNPNTTVQVLIESHSYYHPNRGTRMGFFSSHVHIAVDNPYMLSAIEDFRKLRGEVVHTPINRGARMAVSLITADGKTYDTRVSANREDLPTVITAMFQEFNLEDFRNLSRW